MLWRSTALMLSELDVGIKLDALNVLSGMSAGGTPGLYPEDTSVEKQFYQLIREPLQRQFTTSFQYIHCIVVVIHGLDCCIAPNNEDDWHAFLGTIVRWSKELPWTCKLVITTRSRSELDNASRRLRLDMRDIVVEEWFAPAETESDYELDYELDSDNSDDSMSLRLAGREEVF